MPQNRYKIVFFPKHLKLPQGPPGVPQWTPPQKYLKHNSTWAIVEVFTIIVFEKGKLLGERLARQVWNVDLDSTRHLDRLEVRRGSRRCIKLFWIVFDVFVFDVFEACASNNFESCLMFSPHLSTIWTQSSASAQRLLVTVEKNNEDLSFSY